MARRLSALLLTAAVAALVAGGCGDGTPAQATIVIHYSRFAPELITMRAGVPITITLRNDDPIEHEWIVGAPQVHERHRTGTEPFHAIIPTEVTVPAFSQRVTTLRFQRAGEYSYICHLPGHEAYGMVGTLRVVQG